MTSDNPTPKPAQEVALAMAPPDPRMRRLAQIMQIYEQAIAEMEAIRAAHGAGGEKP